jgi:hypothetical protein
MKGRWMGFNGRSVIIEGPWEWRRDNVKTYPHEIADAGGGGGKPAAPVNAPGHPFERQQPGP